MNKFILNLDPETEIKDANQKLERFIKENIDQIKKFEYCEFRSDSRYVYEWQSKKL